MVSSVGVQISNVLFRLSLHVTKRFFAVESIFQLVDINFQVINDRVNIGDELVQINGIETSTLGSDHVRQLLRGDLGSKALLAFRDLVTSASYTVTLIRHQEIA